VDKGKPLVFLSNLVKNISFYGFQHSVRQRVEVVCSKFQRSQFLDELIHPAHAESFVTSSSRSVLARDSVVNLFYCLADHLFRGFHSADDQFWARRLK